MFYTDINQSKHLLELGLKPKTADMHYFVSGGNIQTSALDYNLALDYSVDSEYSNEIIPCWSVGALLELMPDIIDNRLVGHRLIIDREGKTFNISYDSIITKESVVLYAESNLLDAVYQMMVYLLKNNLLQNNYIKTESL